jgi:hypothetical protein
MLDGNLCATLARAVNDGLVAAALVDRDGEAIALAGAVTDEGAMPLVALVLYEHKSEDLNERLFAGEMLTVRLEDRDLAVAMAKRQLFLVVELGASTPGQLARVEELRADVERMLALESTNSPPPTRGGGAAGSGAPAELQLVDLFGIPVRRRGRA